MPETRGPDVTHMRQMLAIAARARRQRRLVAGIKLLLAVAALAGLAWLVQRGLALLQDPA